MLKGLLNWEEFRSLNNPYIFGGKKINTLNIVAPIK